jgi:hypothetical protein
MAIALLEPAIVPEWGHLLLGPDGEKIRVPYFAFAKLRCLGLLVNNKPRLSRRIYEYLNPEFESLTEGLPKLLGADLSGPSWLVCKCRECSSKYSELDYTRLSSEHHRQQVYEALRQVRARRPAA